jgi:6-phosphogluconolactonase (cycloisomerase 2 family)
MSVPTVATHTKPISIAVDPTGKFAYVANTSSNDISQYTIGGTGALTAIGTPVAAGSAVFGLNIDPSGNYLYATNRGGSTVSQYTINTTTGALTPMGTATVAAGLNPTSIVSGY